MKKDFNNKLFVGITGRAADSLIRKIRECNQFGITEATLFLEFIGEAQKRKVYKELLISKIKKIP